MGWQRRALVAASAAVAVTLSACGGPATAPLIFPSSAAPTGSAEATTAPDGFTAGADGMGDPYLPKAGNGGYDVQKYKIDISYDPPKRLLVGRATITAAATQGLSAFNLDFHGLTVEKVTVDGAPAEQQRQGDELTVTPAAGIAKGATFTTVVDYQGTPKLYTDPTLGSLGFLAKTNGAVAQGEPAVAATWFPVNDHPRDKATYEFGITVPDPMVALSNGTLKGKSAAGGGKTTWNWVEPSPMASYLAMVVIGRYRLQQSQHKGLQVVTAVHESLPSTVDVVMRRTPEINDWLVTKFGPYPFTSLGGIVHNEPQFGFALENQGRPVYSPGFFNSTESAVSVQVHELAHQWFGDSVSVANWRDIWLNEGFATYAEWLWAEEKEGRSAQSQFDRIYNGSDDGDWKVEVADPGLEDLFGFDVYNHGALTVHALRVTIGDEAFFKLLKQWVAAKKDANASTEEFIAMAEQVSGQKLGDFFDDWLHSDKRPPRPTR